MATSATGGYIDPSTGAIYDNALDDLLQQVIVGLTGLAGNLVRPRFPAGTPPQHPEFNVNWISFGVMGPGEEDAYAYERHAAAGDGSSTIERDEVLELRASFYGPNAASLVARFRDGLQVSTNRDALVSADLALIEIRPSTRIPALLSETWVNRINLSVMFRRRTSRLYAVLNLLSSQVTINTEATTATVNINQ